MWRIVFTVLATESVLRRYYRLKHHSYSLLSNNKMLDTRSAFFKLSVSVSKFGGASVELLLATNASLNFSVSAIDLRSMVKSIATQTFFFVIVAIIFV